MKFGTDGLRGHFGTEITPELAFGLGRALAQRDDQLRLLVHQLRNPLAALRTSRS